MSLKRDVYRALEDIVGTDYISEELAILDSYCYHFATIKAEGKYQKWYPRPEAVVLPGSTEDVQALIKACNRYKIRFKGLSTGWGSPNAAGAPGCVLMDLRRMNRILEINDKNMYAVVEPYVISAQFQGELMKKGLNCNIIGAGSNTSALSPLKFIGYGFQGATTSMESRNVLGTEWVLPTGDCLRLGSLGSGTGWFSGDGPGPSLRGIARGLFGAFSGMGVFTKGAVKVYHWPGEPVPTIEGTAPSYGLKITSETLLKAWYISFPSWEAFADGSYKLSESEICYVCTRYGARQLSSALGDNNQHSIEIFEKLKREIKVGGYIIIIAANSRAEFNYREKVLRQIVTETKAKFHDLIEDPKTQSSLLWTIIRASVASKEVFRASGGFSTSFGAMETIDYAANQTKVASSIKDKHLAKRKIIQDGNDLAWGTVYENGHLMHIESMWLFHTSQEGMSGSMELANDMMNAALDTEEKLYCGGAPIGMAGDALHNLFGPRMSNYHIWLRKIKEAFDPNGAAEANFYITPDNSYKDGPFKW